MFPWAKMSFEGTVFDCLVPWSMFFQPNFNLSIFLPCTVFHRCYLLIHTLSSSCYSWNYVDGMSIICKGPDERTACIININNSFSNTREVDKVALLLLLSLLATDTFMSSEDRAWCWEEHTFFLFESFCIILQCFRTISDTF